MLSRRGVEGAPGDDDEDMGLDDDAPRRGREENAGEGDD
jgi:hypothetical protein